VRASNRDQGGVPVPARRAVPISIRDHDVLPTDRLLRDAAALSGGHDVPRRARRLPPHHVSGLRHAGGDRHGQRIAADRLGDAGHAM
ncbi:MAG: hypothetical protein AVDCRST_MAG53-1470, partial [uncultured Solirubrobacteraceae bacterium]